MFLYNHSICNDLNVTYSVQILGLYYHIEAEMNGCHWIWIKISLKFIPKGPINNNPALVQIMAWRPPGNKPLSEPMVVRLLTHICVTRPQWVKCGCVMHIYIDYCHLISTNILSEPIPTYSQLDPQKHFAVKYYSKCHLQNGGHFVPASMC